MAQFNYLRLLSFNVNMHRLFYCSRRFAFRMEYFGFGRKKKTPNWALLKCLLACLGWCWCSLELEQPNHSAIFGCWIFQLFTNQRRLLSNAHSRENICTTREVSNLAFALHLICWKQINYLNRLLNPFRIWLIQGSLGTFFFNVNDTSTPQYSTCVIHWSEHVSR